jgi:hypothetical protein
VTLLSSFPEDARSGLAGILASFSPALGSVTTFAKHGSNLLGVFARNFFLWHGFILQGDPANRAAQIA